MLVKRDCALRPPHQNVNPAYRDGVMAREFEPTWRRLPQGLCDPKSLPCYGLTRSAHPDRSDGTRLV